MTNRLFYIGQVLTLPELSEKLGLESNQFVVTKEIDGGMGSCFKIIDNESHAYALKVILPDLLIDDDSRTRYEKELKEWLTFSACEGVVEALCIITINDIPCIISTWMEHGDMGNIIKAKDPQLFYSAMDRIITTLKWVYEKYHVIHRDLKPGNILLDKKNNAFVGDWGLAKVIYSDHCTSSAQGDFPGVSPNLTGQGTFVGTVTYASPEQLLGKKDIDHRSDIYSLGCIMYQWETGQPPFIGKTIQEIATGQLCSKPQKIGGFFKKTNFRAESIIMKCLEKNPAKRYQTYDELLKDLHKLASKYLNGFVSYKVRERYTAINIGYDEFLKKIKNGELGVLGAKGYRLFELEDLTPYLKEAEHLSALKEHNKVIEIYNKLYNKSQFEKFPDFGYFQFIAINLGNELNKIGEKTQALETILSVSNAVSKPSAYYIDLSNIYISMSRFQECCETCEQGLKVFPNDPDLLGNYTISLTQCGMYDKAYINAKKRLDISRDVHSLCEAGSLWYNYGEECKNSDFPKAIESYKTAYRLYKEALQCNSRYTTALYNAALLLFKMRRYGDSTSIGVEISKIEKGTSETLAFYAARNMQWTSAFQEALDYCNQWLQYYPNSIHLQRIKAEILVDECSIGNYAKNGLPIVNKFGLEFFTNITKDNIKREPSDIIFLAKLHCWINDSKNINYGIELLKYGDKYYRNIWQFNFYLAAFYLQYNKPKEALEEALKCKEKAPWRETVYNILSKAYAANGEELKAIEASKEHDRIKAIKKSLYDSCKEL